MKATQLNETHKNLKAKLGEFAGYEMPLLYKSTKEEVLSVRNNAGMFDVSHMGEFFVEGPDACKFVDYFITNDFLSAPIGKAVYSPLCNHEGKILDDLIAYKLAEEKVLVCVNAGNIEKDWNWINQLKSDEFSCQLSNQSDQYSLLALQGPKSEEVVKNLGLKITSSLGYYEVCQDQLGGHQIFAARTGYTGEDGFELFIKNDGVQQLWDKLAEQKVSPCGLVARDVLRLEVGFPLYGQDLSEEVTPLDCSLKWTVKFNKEKFVGKSALIDYQPKTRLIKLSLEKGIPRSGYTVLDKDNNPIGKITSGGHSVMLNGGIAFASIKNSGPVAETDLFYIEIRNNMVPAKYHRKAFYNGGHK